MSRFLSPRDIQANIQIYLTKKNKNSFSSILKPSVTVVGAVPRSQKKLTSMPGELGFIKLPLVFLAITTTSLSDYLAAIRTVDLSAYTKAGATVILNMFGIPLWLSSSSDKTINPASGVPNFSIAPPKDLNLYSQYIQETVRFFGDNFLYEFSNEPGSTLFWSGTAQQLFDTYVAFARGARVLPNAKIGGLATSPWNSSKENDPSTFPLLQRWINSASSTNTPIDFISWHNFNSFPDKEWKIAYETIQSWLDLARYKKTLQIVTEWQMWRTFPNFFDSGRDTEEGAAYILNAMIAMRENNIFAATYANIKDFSGETTPFHGDWGLFTWDAEIGKCSYFALYLLSYLTNNSRKEIESLSTNPNIKVLASCNETNNNLVLAISQFTDTITNSTKVDITLNKGTAKSWFLVRISDNNPKKDYESAKNLGFIENDAVKSALQSDMQIRYVKGNGTLPVLDLKDRDVQFLFIKFDSSPISSKFLNSKIRVDSADIQTNLLDFLGESKILS